jgi:RNA polymerase sigma-70 factor (ECF subfamily)
MNGMEARDESSGCSQTAFLEFYDRASGEVSRYFVRGVLGDRATAEDLTQEAFAAVVVAARAGRPEALTMPWVMGVARHKLVDHYRRSAADQRHLAQVWSRTSDELELDVLDSCDPSRVLEMMRKLIPQYRLVLVLKYVDEQSAQEIAITLNRSLHATNSLLSRARRALVSSLAEEQS